MAKKNKKLPNPDLVKVGKDTRFSSTNQPKKNGRKKKIKTILKDHGFEAPDIIQVFDKMSWYTLDELQKAFNDGESPIILRIAAQQFYLALKNGDMGKIREILDHVIGRAPATIDLTTAGEKIVQVFKVGDQEIEF